MGYQQPEADDGDQAPSPLCWRQLRQMLLEPSGGNLSIGLCEVDPLQLVAYVDESRKPDRSGKGLRVSGKGDFYAVCAAVMFDADRGDLRSQLEMLEQELGNLHYGELSKTRACELAECVGVLGDWEAHVYESAGPLVHRKGSESRLRSLALRQALPDLAGHGVKDFRLETRAKDKPEFQKLDQNDMAVVDKLRAKGKLTSDHRLRHVTKADVLLAIPDVLAGARTDLLTTKNPEPWAYLTHRAKVTKVA